VTSFPLTLLPKTAKRSISKHDRLIRKALASVQSNRCSRYRQSRCYREAPVVANLPPFAYSDRITHRAEAT
jgi:hypothetical protein